MKKFLTTIIALYAVIAYSQQPDDSLKIKDATINCEQSRHVKLLISTPERLAAITQKIGYPIPEFTLIDRDKKEVSSADFKGQYLLIDFWGSWCAPCRRGNPKLVELYNKYKDVNFEILGLASERGNSDEAWLKAIEDDGLTWRQVNLTANETGREVLNNYNILAFPTKILICPNGKMLKFFEGTSPELEVRLKEIFGF